MNKVCLSLTQSPPHPPCVLKSTTGHGKLDSNTPTYVITLRASKGTVPVEVRLRQLLKIAWRAFKLRAVDVREIPPMLAAGERTDDEPTDSTSPTPTPENGIATRVNATNGEHFLGSPGEEKPSRPGLRTTTGRDSLTLGQT